MSISYCLGIAATVAIWMGPHAGVGYLARVGPAPLRFEAPRKPKEEVTPLPPLAMTEPPAPPMEEFGPPASPEQAAPVGEVFGPPPAPVIVQAAPGPENLTPRMFLQYFNGKNGTNQDVSVVVPYEFTPPPAANIPPPPSRATYQVK